MRTKQTDFWATPDGDGEAAGYEKLAARDPLSVQRPPLSAAISVLMAGAVATTPSESGLSSVVVHAVTADGASLCQRVSPDALLRSDDGLWSSVPGYERCLECEALA
jgi:hypothetical protein